MAPRIRRWSRRSWLAAALLACACGPDPHDRSERAGNPDTEAAIPKDGAAAAKAKTLLVIGDSLSAGYGLTPEQAWPALLQRKLDDAGESVRVVNAGESGQTTAGGIASLRWRLGRADRDDAPPDFVILALGGNDVLRGIDPAEVQKNLETMIEMVRAKAPGARVILAGMRAPPSMGADYAERFAAVYPRVAKERDCTLLPFLLEGVAGDRALNQDDGIHPTPRGQEIVAETVWKVVRELM